MICIKNWEGENLKQLRKDWRKNESNEENVLTKDLI
jgi:hypothetical protein